ncbi:MAG: EamA/RhaT family transporter [Pseudomonadota bacterium]
MNGWTVDSWVLLSLAAAGFQTLRFALQKVLSTRSLTPTGATFARFVYSAPIVAIAMASYLLWTGQGLPTLPSAFWGFAMLGGFAQVMATVFVVTLFKSRNFAVGVTLMKTEVILSVVVGLVLLGETVGLLAFGAILFGLVGVLLLSTPPEIKGWGWAEMANRSVALGLGAGLLFAVSAVCYRGASLEIASEDAVVRAGLTLSAVTAMQMVGMALWLRLRDADQILAVWRARRVAIWIGLMSLAGSFCWFWAFTLQTAAYVKAVGQVELIFSLLVSVLLFSERSSWRELAGMAVLSLSILTLVLVI